MPPISYNGRRALAHLKTIKPAGGWAIDMNKDTKEYRLLKRGGIPLTQRYFKDIHHDVVTGNVVGIVTKGPPTKGQVLVDDQGSPLPRSQLAIIKVATWTNTAKVRPKRNADRERRVGRIENYSLSEEHGHRLIKVAIYIVGASIAIKALMNVFEALYIFLIPLIFLIALVTVPSETDFDVKSEVKQALLRRHQFHDQGLEISDKVTTISLATLTCSLRVLIDITKRS